MTLVASEWDVLSHGGANAILTYNGTGPWKGKLLRLRLASDAYVGTETIVRYASKIRSHLQVVDMQTVFLSRQFRDEIAERVCINPDEQYGIIMPDLLPDGKVETRRASKHVVLHQYRTSTVVEIKPKWLYSLPEGILSCRNCAVSIMRTGTRSPCPLDLLKEETVGRWLKSCGIETEPLLKRALGSVVPVLFDLQSGIDMHAETRALDGEVSPRFLEHMALRDVTLFITLSDHYEVQLVDIDIKSAERWEKWKTVEMKLMDSGLYSTALVPPCNRV